MKIAIDAGHGGVKNGKYATSPNFSEKDKNTWAKLWVHEGFNIFEGEINRKIAKHLEDYLKSKGHEIVKIYEDYTDNSLPDRVNRCNNANCDVYISIHGNAASNTKASGFEIFSTKNKTASDDLALSIHKVVKEQVLTKWEIKDRGHKEENFYVILKAKCKAVLIETAFFSNKEEAVKMMNEEFQKDIAYAIGKGILENKS